MPSSRQRGRSNDNSILRGDLQAHSQVQRPYDTWLLRPLAIASRRAKVTAKVDRDDTLESSFIREM